METTSMLPMVTLFLVLLMLEIPPFYTFMPGTKCMSRHEMVESWICLELQMKCIQHFQEPFWLPSLITQMVVTPYEHIFCYSISFISNCIII